MHKNGRVFYFSFTKMGRQSVDRQCLSTTIAMLYSIDVASDVLFSTEFEFLEFQL